MSQKAKNGVAIAVSVVVLAGCAYYLINKFELFNKNPEAKKEAKLDEDQKQLLARHQIAKLKHEKEMAKTPDKTIPVPVKLAKAYVADLILSNLDPESGKLIAQNDEAWTVEFSVLEEKAKEKGPKTRIFKVYKKNGSVVEKIIKPPAIKQQ